MAYIVRSSDPVIRAVVLEDSAALIGLCLAAAGLLFSKTLGTSVPDALASLLIGLLLAVTAFGVARPLADFLVGRSLPAPLFEKLQAIVKGDAVIERVLSLRTMYSGPEEVIVVAKVHPSGSLDIEQLTRAMDDPDGKISVRDGDLNRLLRPIYDGLAELRPFGVGRGEVADVFGGKIRIQSR